MPDAPNTWSQRLRAAFVAGMLVTVPFGVTVGVLLFLVTRVDALQPTLLLGRPIPGLGLLLVTAAIFGVGFAMQRTAGRQLVGWVEGLVHRVPVVETLYRGVKQVVETAIAEGSRSVKGVVLVEWPRKGTWSLGFLTGDSFVRRADGVRMLNVFVPSTPNPTTGFYFIVAESEVVRTGLTVEDAAKMLMSAGLVSSPQRVVVPAPPADEPPTR